MALYPCRECILFGNCSEICKKLIDGNIKFIMVDRKECVDCGGDKFVRHYHDMENESLSCTICNSLFRIHHGELSLRILSIHRHLKVKFEWGDCSTVTFDGFLKEFDWRKR